MVSMGDQTSMENFKPRLMKHDETKQSDKMEGSRKLAIRVASTRMTPGSTIAL